MEIRPNYIKIFFNEKRWQEGKKHYLRKQVTLVNVDYGLMDDTDEMSCDVVAQVAGAGGHVFQVRLLLGETSIYHMQCNCSSFNKSRHYGYYFRQEGCEHIAAVAMAVILETHRNPPPLITHPVIVDMIGAYEEKNIISAQNSQILQRLELEPRIERTEGDYLLNFRIGTNKKYVIRDLWEFAARMQNHERFEYGKDLEFLHDMGAFTSDGKKLAEFILGRVRESNYVVSRISNQYYAKLTDRRSFPLTPAAMDELFDILFESETKLYFIDRTQISEKQAKAEPLQLRKKNQKLHLDIIPLQRTNKDGEKIFNGIRIKSDKLNYIVGDKHCYLIQDGIMYQTDNSYKKAMAPFLKGLEKTNAGVIEVGKDMLGSFYHHVLERIEDYAQIEETGTEEIRDNIPPSPEFVFYLDYTDKKNIICRMEIHYGDKIRFPYTQKEGDAELRDFTKEYEIIMRIQSFLPFYDEKKQLYHCGSEEEEIYDFLERGLSALMEMGQVNISDEFKKLQIRPAPKVSVGVSLVSSLLNLEFDSDTLDFSEMQAILDSYKLKKKYHRLKSGDFLNLEGNSLETLMELVESLHIPIREFAQGQLSIPAYRALYLDKVLQESEGIALDRDKNFKSLLRSFKSVEDSEFEVPASLKPILRNYQKHGFRWLKTIEQYGFGGILADDMGLGKTLQVIAILLAAKEEGKSGPSLVICPASLVYNWENECREFGPQLDVVVITGTAPERKNLIENSTQADLYVTSYDLLKRDIEHYENIQFLYEIIDEAQYIKNHTTQGAKAVKIIKAKIKFALTGTPIENRLSELWSIFDYLMPGFLYTYDRFKKDLETPITKNSDEVLIQRLRKMVSPFILRRLKENVLKDLPAKLEQNTYTRFDKQQQELYDAYVAKIRQSLGSQSPEEFEKNKLKILAELTRLRQICCAPSLCFEDYKGESAKLDTCLELVENAIEGGHKILLFSQFTSMLDVIGRELSERNIEYYKIIGATVKEQRVRLVKMFNEDQTPVFLISLKAGGTGLNLTGADIVIHYDPWWNAAAQNQATDRAHRIGQKNKVTVFKLIAKGTIEEKILKMQEAKKNLADQIISGETNRLSSMSKEDFLELL